MRFLIALAMLAACLSPARAQSPPSDNSAAYFSGEWSGPGEQGNYCYVKLATDGAGWVLVDGGSGDWLGARMQWRNRQQSLLVGKIVPLAASPQFRVMPLGTFVLASGFNQSLRLTWNRQIAGCQLQKVDTTARRLDAARSAITGMAAGESRR